MSFRISVVNKDFINVEYINTLGQSRVSKLIDELKEDKNVLKIVVYGAFLEQKWSTEDSLDIYLELKEDERPMFYSMQTYNMSFITNFSEDYQMEIGHINLHGVTVYEQGKQRLVEDNFFSVYSYGYHILKASKRMLDAAYHSIGCGDDDTALTLLTKSLTFAVRFFLYSNQIEFDLNDNVINMFNRAEKFYKPVPIDSIIDEHDFTLLSDYEGVYRRIAIYDVYQVYEEVSKSISKIESEVGRKEFRCLKEFKKDDENYEEEGQKEFKS